MGLDRTMISDTTGIIRKEGSSKQAMEAYLDDYIDISFSGIDVEFWYAVVFIPNSKWLKVNTKIWSLTVWCDSSCILIHTIGGVHYEKEKRIS